MKGFRTVKDSGLPQRLRATLPASSGLSATLPKQTLIAFLFALLATTAFSIDPAPVSSNAVLAIDPKARACCNVCYEVLLRLPAIPTRS